MKLNDAIEYLKEGTVIYRPGGVMFSEYDKDMIVSFEDALADDWKYAKDFKKLCDIKCVADNTDNVFFYKSDKMIDKRIVFNKNYQPCGLINYNKFIEVLLSNNCCVANWTDIKMLDMYHSVLMQIIKDIMEN